MLAAQRQMVNSLKKIDDFMREETGEEWLRELYKVVSARRGVMFRLISEATRMLLIGNAGGAALLIGLMSAGGGGAEDPVFHWLALVTLIVFGIGILASAATTVLVALVAIKEAHGTETGLKHFVDGETSRSDVLFAVDTQTLRIADLATLMGVLSASTFLIGGVSSIILLTLFF